jgi:hypothetical protein
MENTKIFLMFAGIFSLGLQGYLYTLNNAYAQGETVEDFDKIAGDENTQIIENNTAISNPNNTILDAEEVNIEEDCMTLPDGSKDCP